MGYFSSANVYTDRWNSKFGVYCYHILVCIGTHKYHYSSISYQDNQLDTCVLFGDLHSEKAFVQALDITNFFLFVWM